MRSTNSVRSPERRLGTDQQPQPLKRIVTDPRGRYQARRLGSERVRAAGLLLTFGGAQSERTSDSHLTLDNQRYV